MHRRLTGRLVIATHNPGKLAEMRELLAPLRRRAGFRGRTRPRRARGDRQDVSPRMRRSRRSRPRRRRNCRRLPTIPASRRCARRRARASSRPLGRRRARTSWRQCAGSSDELQERGATTPDQRRRAFRLGAVPRLARRPSTKCSRPASTARWSGRRAAPRVSATIRCSCPTGTTRTFGEMTLVEKHGLPPHRARPVAPRAAPSCKLAEHLPLASARSRAPTAKRLRRLRALAVLPGQVPVLRFQHPRPPRADRRGALCRAPSRARSTTTAARAPGRTVTSIFFGGGTPSLMEPHTVGAILDAIGKHWRVAPDVEVTLEANPTSVEATRFRGYRAAGVNRVSLGVQALDDAVAEGARPPAQRARGAGCGRDRAQSRSTATRST